MMQIILVIGAVLCFAQFAVKLVRSQERTSSHLFLALALLVVLLLELLNLALVSWPERALLWERLSLLAEALLPGVWLLCCATHARSQGLRSLSRFQLGLLGGAPLFLLPALFAPLTSFFYAPDFPAEQVFFLQTTGYFFYLGLTGYLLLSLINLEKTLTSASPGELWKIKFEALGIGLILVVYILYYSQGVLFRTINMQYAPLRALFLILAMVLMIVSRLRQGAMVRIQVSRQLAFKSLVLLVFGGYLVLVGLLGEGMKYFGIPFQQSMAIALALLLGVGLLILLMSGRVRRQVKVFLHKNFYENKYDYRTQWLQFTERLAVRQSGADLQQVILSAYCETFGINKAAMFLLDQERGTFANTAVYEMEPIPTTFSRDSRLVHYLEERRWVFSSQDDNPEIAAECGEFLVTHEVSFIVPLSTQETVEGFIVLGRLIHPNETYIYEDFDLMKTIARQASFAILNQRLAEQLTRLRETEAIGNIATFVIHDLKNHVAALSLTVDNARQYIDNPEFQQDMLHSLDNTVTKMQGLISRLKNLGERELLHLHPVPLLELATRTAAIVSGAAVQISGRPAVALGDGEELQKVVLNLLINAVEASSSQTPVLLEVGEVPMPHVRVTDRGCGMSLEFQQRELFKPFVTTKKKGLGIGLYQCRQIVEAHGGRIEVQSEEGSGSTFTVWLPGIQ